MMFHEFLVWLNSGLGLLGFLFAFAGTGALIEKKFRNALIMFGLVALSLFMVWLLNYT